jgi:hypothetical protein
MKFVQKKWLYRYGILRRLGTVLAKRVSTQMEYTPPPKPGSNCVGGRSCRNVTNLLTVKTLVFCKGKHFKRALNQNNTGDYPK